MLRKQARSIEAVIFDWAGTTIDYGCFAPVDAFIKTFEKQKITVSADQIRAFMGLKKRDHLQCLLDIPSEKEQWHSIYGKLPDDKDLERLYIAFEALLFEQLTSHTDPIPGTLEVVDALREMDIKIGSSTGYTKEMMRIIAPEAEAKGYRPDFLVASDEVAKGRPAPYMCYRNMLALEVYPAHACVKVGDTLSDIGEGRNAGMWTIAIVEGGSELGLSEQDVIALSQEHLERRKVDVKRKFQDAGAHYIAESIKDVVDIVNKINERLAADPEGGEVVGYVL